MAVMGSAGKAAAPATPPAPPGTPQPPAAVPRSKPAPTPEPEAPPPPAYKTYSTRTPQRAPKPPAKTAEPQPAPAAAAPPPAAAPTPDRAAAASPPPGAALPGDPPPPPRRSPGAAIGDGFRNLDRRVYAILAAVVVGGLLVFGIAALGGKSKDKVPPEPTQAAAVVAETPKAKKTPKPKPVAAAPALKTQAQEVDRLLKFSQAGRADAVNGDFKAATANRTKLLKDLQSLQGKATDAQLKAGVTAFAAAIRESLRQNRECGSKCSTSDITKVGTLKQTALDKLNPLLKKFGLGPYTTKQI
jgi:hypothetical protein